MNRLDFHCGRPLAGLLALLAVSAGLRADPAAQELVTLEDTPILRVPLLNIGAGFTNARATVTTASTNVLLLPTTAVTVAGTGTGTTASFHPGPDQNGLVTARVVLAQGDASVTNDFRITVTPVNDAPRISPVPDQLLFQGGGYPRIIVTVTDPDGDFPSLTLRLVRGTGRNLVVFPAPLAPAPGQPAWVRKYQLNFEQGDGFPGSYLFDFAATDGQATNHQALTVVIQPNQFAAPSQNVLNNSGDTMDFVDVDADGYPDLTVNTGTVLPGPTILRNSFGRLSGTANPSLVNADIPVWDDFDGDGIPDCVVLSSGRQRLEFWKTSAPITRLTLASTAPASVVDGVKAVSGDFDGDGDPDVVFANPSAIKGDAGVWLARNRGDGTFDLERITGAVPGGSVAAADIDDDGDLDLVMTDAGNGGGNTVAVWINDGTGHFTRSDTALPTGTFASLGLADFDGDGHPDLWLAESNTSINTRLTTNRLAVLSWSPAGFHETWSATCPTNAGYPTAIVSDFDGDGYPDIIGMAQVGAQTGWFLFANDGEARFKPTSFLVSNQSAPRPAVGDLNGDSRPDVVVGRATSNLSQSTVYTNGTLSFNPPPNAPRNPRSRIDGKRLTLEWDEASDLIQRGALTYNVRAGFRAGGHDLVPALARADGYRLVTRPGNAGFRHSLDLDLSSREGEAVFWAVQAVDAGGQGGPFSDEQLAKVLLGGQPPVISAIADVAFDEDTIHSIAFTATDVGTPPTAIQIRAYADPNGIIDSLSLDPPRSERHLLTIRPISNANGSTTIHVVATDPVGFSTTNQFVVTYNPVNDPPAIDSIPNRVAFAGETIPPFRIRVSDPETPAGQLSLAVEVTTSLEPIPAGTFRIASVGDSTAEISAPGAVFPPQGVGLRVTATDPEGLVAQRSFSIDLRPRLLADHARFPGPVGLSVLSLGDLDGDGHPDLLGIAAGKLFVWHNEGTNAWTPIDIPIPPDFAVFAARWCDIDRDGRLEIACFGNTLSSGDHRDLLRIVSFAGNVASVGDAQTPLPNGMYYAALADVDDDGQLDLIANGNAPNGEMALFVAQGDTSGFLDPALAVLGSGDVHVLDLDLDGRTDIYTSGVPYGYGTQTPSGWLRTALGWQIAGASLLADIDHDGRWDAVVTDLTQGFPSRVFSPALTATHPIANLPFSVPQVAAVVDIDGDGFADVLHSDASGRLVMRAGRSGGWGDPRTLYPDHVSGATAGDIDGDGRADVVIATTPQDSDGNDPVTIVVLRNTLAPESPAPPAPPVAFDVLLEADAAYLEWPARAEDTARGITYNIRVGSTPGGSDIIGSLSGADGRRLVVEPGNAGIARRRRVAGLAIGNTYYAAVQCIDAAGTGGPFSAEITFTTRAHLLALALPDSLPNEPAAAEITVPVGVSGADGALRITASTAPASLLFEPSPVVVTTDGGFSVRLRFRPGMQGAGRLDLQVVDASHATARGTVAIVHGEAPANADVLVDRVLSTHVAQPVAVGFTSVAPAANWTSQELSFPEHGSLLSDFPDAYYIPQAGFTGSDQFTWLGTLDDGTRVLERIRIDVAGTGTDRITLRSKGQLDLAINRPPGESGVLQRSTDLVHWEILGTYSVPETGVYFQQSVDDASRATAAFYRLLPTNP